MATLRSISHQGNYKHVPRRLAYLIRFLMALKNWEKEVWKEQKNKGTSKRGLVESVQIMQLGPVVEKNILCKFISTHLGKVTRCTLGTQLRVSVRVCACMSACERGGSKKEV